MHLTRPLFLITSLLPLTLGIFIAYSHKQINYFINIPLAILGMTFLHLAINLTNEIYDYRNGIDIKENIHSTHILAQVLLSDKEAIILSWIFYFIAFIFGLIIILIVKSWVLFLLMLMGFFGGYFYTAPPINYKYFALGDIMIFILMGSLLVLGSYFAFSGSLNLKVFLIAIPFGFLITSVLHANNSRDIESDSKTGVKTLASLLGYDKSRILYVILVFKVFISQIILIIFGLLSITSLLTILSIPLAVKNYYAVFSNKINLISTLDLSTVNLYIFFGSLYIFSFLL